MKATINGIFVEGTPEEIAQYERIKMQEAVKYMKDSTRMMYEQWKTQTTCGATTNVPMDYQKWG